MTTRELLAARSAYRCEARTIDCAGDATDWHHRLRRRDGGDDITNALHLCRPCHALIHAHPRMARVAGWIVSAWGDPDTTPVRVRGRWVYLTPDGGRDPAPEPAPDEQWPGAAS